MNAALLARFVLEMRDELVGRSLGTPSYFAPVLAIPFYGRRHLVIVLESPGPFCFLAHASPFESARAPACMAKLIGATVVEVELADARVLRIDTTTDAHEHLSLFVALFGAAGSARLVRGETTDEKTIIETIGKGRTEMTREAPQTTEPPFVETPFYLVVRGSVGAATPSPDPVDGAMGPFSSARAACAELGRRVLRGAHEMMVRRVSRPLRRRVESLARLNDNLADDIERAAEHAELRREAETLAAFQARVPTGASLIELPDVYDNSQTRAISLDPAEPVHVQIEKRFRRATKLKKSAEHAARRLDLVRREHDELSSSLTLLESTTSFSDAIKLVETIRAKFDIDTDQRLRPVGATRRREPEKTYRTYDVDARWFVLVGRSNFENDEITFQVAKPTDLWFHAQSVPGSHVILRSRGGSDGPPSRVIERAASIAAHFSKAKHSALVPVIYTQRKYVRKFRGAKPGQVVCEREKMMMVPPILPEEGPP
jgi:NFACT N-terminal and middle domains/NFACT protein RNA binding domain